MSRLTASFERLMEKSPILTWTIYPAYAIYWIVRYAGAQPTWPRKIGTFVVFIPVLAISAALWAAVVCAIAVLGWQAFINLLSK